MMLLLLEVVFGFDFDWEFDWELDWLGGLKLAWLIGLGTGTGGTRTGVEDSNLSIYREFVE
jgi:hypothetical protein